MHVASHHRQAAVFAVLIKLGQALEFPGRDEKAGVGHVERLENALLQKFLEAHAGEFLYDIALNIRGNAVMPFAAGLRVQGQLCNALDEFLRSIVDVEHIRVAL
jgi:hypothetical protein